MNPPDAGPHSLRNRLILALGGGLVVLWLVGVGLAGHVVRKEIDEVFDSALQEVVQGILPLAYSDILNRWPDQQPAQRAPYVNRQQETISYIVRDREGRVLLQSHDANLELFPPTLTLGFQNTPGARLYSEAAVSNTIFATALEAPGHREKAIRDATLALSVPLILFVPTMVVGIWTVVQAVLRPVTALGAAIEQRGSGDLSAISVADLPSELRPVGRAVNGMLARLRRTLDSERSFSANSAHELRTPLAGALSQTQRLIAEMTAPAARARLREIEQSLHRIARTTEKLLQLARAEGAVLLAPSPRDLAPILTLVARDFELPQGSHGAMEVEPTWSRLDLDAFAIVARNLIENAVRHGLPDEAIVIRLANSVLSVRNHGPVLTPEQFEQMKLRFRQQERKSLGAGLGLAIVSTIANGSGGRLEILSPMPEARDGVEIRFHLPEARARRRA